MRCLFIDLASHDALLACVTERRVSSSRSVHSRIGDHELIPLVESLLSEAGWRYEDVTHVACVIGPGGFTSLRVALAFANVLADQLGIPLAGIHLSDLYRVRVGDRDRKEEVYWLHSTKRDQLFICGGKWKEPTLIDIHSLSPIPQYSNPHSPVFQSPTPNPYPILWMGELIPEHRAKIGTDPVQLTSLTEILPAFLAAQTYSKKSLQPWYGRGW